MANLGAMTSWMMVILSNQLDETQIATLLNKADLEEVESWSWSRLKARTTINTFPATTFPSITVMQGSTTVTANAGNFPIIPNTDFVLAISGQTFAPIGIMPNPSPSGVLTLNTFYPGASSSTLSGTLFPLYYTVPGWQEINGVQQQVDLAYMTADEVYHFDPYFVNRSSPARNWIPDGHQDGTDDARFMLWPIETVANGYTIHGLRNHVDMINPTDIPAVPSAVIVAKALSEACESLYTLRGDQQWADMRTYYRQIYSDELEKARERDRLQYGVIRQVHSARQNERGLDVIAIRDGGSWE